MKLENKNSDTNKATPAGIDPSKTMDEKTYQQYKLEARGIVVRASVTAIMSWLALTGLAYISFDSFAMFHYMSYFPALFAGVFVYANSRSKLNAKYNIPTVFHSSQKASFLKSQDYGYNNPLTKNDVWRDDDPSQAGSLASWSRNNARR
jgi:hypothetical protein